jgi:electron transfer flavoprotein beta subunit
MAIGADRAILVETDVELQPLAVAKLLKALVDKEQPQLVIWASRPSTTMPTRPARCWPPCRAGRRHLRLKVEVAADKVDVTREIDGGLETVSCAAGRVTTDLRLNEPRYVTLPNIMKAKKKPLDTVKPEDLGVDVTRA